MSQKSLRDALEESFDVTDSEEEETEEFEEEQPDTGATGEGESLDDDDAPDTEDEGGDETDKPVSAEADEPPDEGEGDEEEEDKPEDTIPPPVSWKPAARELWNKLPKAAQLEVQRRETEISRGLQQASNHKKIASEYFEIVRPYEQLMRANGHTPRESIEGLLQSAAALQVGQPAQKVRIVTDIIKSYGIDIQMLDQALAGEELPDSQFAPVQQMLQQELAPVRQFMGQFQQTQEQSVNEATAKVQQDLQDFVSNPKHEFFEDVRDDMADLMELAARRERSMTLEEAYDKACRENPEINKILKQREAAAKANKAARLSGHTGSKKRHASASVRSAPPSGASADESDSSLRSIIERAMEDQEEGTI
jgi:hypothetical protein